MYGRRSLKTCCRDRTCRKPMEETPNYIPNKTSVIFSGNHNTFKQNIPWTPRNAENLLLIKLHEMSLQSSMLSWKPIHQCAAWSAISRATNVGPKLLVTLPEDLNKNAPLGNYGSKVGRKAQLSARRPLGRKAVLSGRCMRPGGLL